uniref:Uncharacterized protein n=1 Tax=Arundo donax TaxID=35708 RepID=A0A0A8Z641_ARUDO
MATSSATRANMAVAALRTLNHSVFKHRLILAKHLRFLISEFGFIRSYPCLDIITVMLLQVIHNCK